jgi:antitoxin (DNA-binding transcriptional repressor) of toxin-antitoxin stability system
MHTITVNNSEKTIAINDLRRKFGEIEEALPFVDHFILTKKGRPFAILSATPSVKREQMKKTAGAFKNTKLATDAFWKDVLKKKSRKTDINL